MRLKKLIKRFDFTENNRNNIELGINVRLDPKEQYVKLTKTNNVYPLDSDLYVKTWSSNPNSVKQWLNFECVIINERDKDDYNTIVTGANFRLHDDDNEYWFNGTSWEINYANWNTESEVASNITSFPVSSKKIGFVVNLYTTDETKTPVIKALKVLYSSDVEHQDDYVYRTLVKQLAEQVRPIGDYPVTLATSSSTIDLENDFPLETPYNLIDIDSVYNHTDDPNHYVDILQSYDNSTKVITMSETISSGKIVWIKFTYSPEIAVSTGLEYYEVEKVPILILGNINLINTTKITKSDSVINKETGIGTKVLPPDRSDLDVTMNIITSTARDQVRLADELKRFFANNPMLTTWGTDEKFALQLDDEYDGTISVDSYGARNSRIRFKMIGTLYFVRGDVIVYSIENFNITGNIINDT